MVTLNDATIQSVRSGRYLTVGADGLVHTETGDPSLFDVLPQADGAWVVRYKLTGKYLSDPATGAPAAATARTAGASESFTLVDRGGGKFALQSTRSRRYLHDGNGDAVLAFDAATAGATEEFAIEPAPVTIYEHANFGGRSMNLGVGRYDIGQLGIGNDQVSSARVPAGYRLTLFQHAGFAGSSVSYTSDAASVGAFDDQASSVVVERHAPVARTLLAASSAGQPTAAASTAASVPKAIQDLGKVDVSVFFVKFDLPIRFQGDIVTQPLSKSVSYSGKAELVSPFDVTVDPLEVALFAAEGDDGKTGAGWRLKFGLPQSRSLSAVIEDQVFNRMPREIQPVVRTLVMPYLALYDHSTIVLSNQEGEDEQLGSYIAGFNGFSTLKVSQIPPFDLLARTFPQLGLDQRSVVLGVGAASGATGDFFVGMQLDLNVALGTPLIVFNSLGLNVSKVTTDTSVGADIVFTLTLAGDELHLRGGLTVTTGAGAKVTVWGALDAAGGAWTNPLGIRGLSIVGMGVEVGATPTFPWVVLGVRGEAHIGDGLLGGRIGLLVDASDWSKCILDIYSQEGLQLPKLVRALTGRWLDAANLIDVAITDLQLYVAPKGGSIAGKTYEAGLAIGGKLDLWGFKASVDGKLDYDSGGYFKGAMDPVRLSAGGTSFLEVTSADGKAGASIDIEAGTSGVGGTVDGVFSLLGGLYKSQTKAALNSKGFTATLVGSGLGIYQSTVITLQSGLFRLSYGPTIGVNVKIAGRQVGLSVSTTITTEISSTRFAQSISFQFSAMGTSYSPGPFGIQVPFKDVASLADAFAAHAADLIVNGLVKGLQAAGEAAFSWVRQNVSNKAEEASKFLKAAGADPTKIAQGAVKFMGATAGDAVKYLELGADGSAKVLKEGFGWTSEQTGKWLRDVGGFSQTAANEVLQGAGYVISGASTVGSVVAGAASDAGKAIGGVASDAGKAISSAGKSVGKAFKKY